MRRLYATSAVIGTLVPWLFFGSFFAANDLDVAGFLSGLFANGTAGRFSADALIFIAIFWLLSCGHAQRHRIRRWWLVLPAGFTVGPSLALPLYLWLREPTGAHVQRTLGYG